MKNGKKRENSSTREKEKLYTLTLSEDEERIIIYLPVCVIILCVRKSYAFSDPVISHIMIELKLFFSFRELWTSSMTIQSTVKLQPTTEHDSRCLFIIIIVICLVLWLLLDVFFSSSSFLHMKRILRWWFSISANDNWRCQQSSSDTITLN